MSVGFSVLRGALVAFRFAWGVALPGRSWTPVVCWLKPSLVSSLRRGVGGGGVLLLARASCALVLRSPPLVLVALCACGCGTIVFAC